MAEDPQLANIISNIKQTNGMLKDNKTAIKKSSDEMTKAVKAIRADEKKDVKKAEDRDNKKSAADASFHRSQKQSNIKQYNATLKGNNQTREVGEHLKELNTKVDTQNQLTKQAETADISQALNLTAEEIKAAEEKKAAEDKKKAAEDKAAAKDVHKDLQSVVQSTRAGALQFSEEITKNIKARSQESSKASRELGVVIKKQEGIAGNTRELIGAVSGVFPILGELMNKYDSWKETVTEFAKNPLIQKLGRGLLKIPGVDKMVEGFKAMPEKLFGGIRQRRGDKLTAQEVEIRKKKEATLKQEIKEEANAHAERMQQLDEERARRLAAGEDVSGLDILKERSEEAFELRLEELNKEYDENKKIREEKERQLQLAKEEEAIFGKRLTANKLGEGEKEAAGAPEMLALPESGIRSTGMQLALRGDEGPGGGGGLVPAGANAMKDASLVISSTPWHMGVTSTMTEMKELLMSMMGVQTETKEKIVEGNIIDVEAVEIAKDQVEETAELVEAQEMANEIAADALEHQIESDQRNRDLARLTRGKKSMADASSKIGMMAKVGEKLASKGGILGSIGKGIGAIAQAYLALKAAGGFKGLLKQSISRVGNVVGKSVSGLKTGIGKVAGGVKSIAKGGLNLAKNSVRGLASGLQKGAGRVFGKQAASFLGKRAGLGLLGTAAGAGAIATTGVVAAGGLIGGVIGKQINKIPAVKKAQDAIGGKLFDLGAGIKKLVTGTDEAKSGVKAALDEIAEKRRGGQTITEADKRKSRLAAFKQQGMTANGLNEQEAEAYALEREIAYQKRMKEREQEAATRSAAPAPSPAAPVAVPTPSREMSADEEKAIAEQHKLIKEAIALEAKAGKTGGDAAFALEMQAAQLRQKAEAIGDKLKAQAMGEPMLALPKGIEGRGDELAKLGTGGGGPIVINNDNRVNNTTSVQSSPTTNNTTNNNTGGAGASATHGVPSSAPPGVMMAKP